MAETPFGRAALYDHFGWRLQAVSVGVHQDRLTETHEYFHRQLDDTTAFGGLLGTVAALADGAQADPRWVRTRHQLQDMSDVVHETFAVGMSLLTTQRSIEPIAGYPMYDRHVRTVNRLIGTDVHPWIALGAIRAAAVSSMQTSALHLARTSGLLNFDPKSLPLMERPNHRLRALIRGGFFCRVREQQLIAIQSHREETWWLPGEGITLSPDSMDGPAGEAFATLMRYLVHDAEEIIDSADGIVVPWDNHHEDLRGLLDNARRLAPDGLTRIGALVESPGGELLHGGPLDGQILELTGVPDRAIVMSHDSTTDASDEGDRKHVFVVLTTPRRLHAAHNIEGLGLPEVDALACMRSTVFEGQKRDSVLLVPLDDPEEIQEDTAIYLSVMSSAIAADPTKSTTWMRWADLDKLSLVMDTPATAALRRWCANGTRFTYDIRQVLLDEIDIRIIVGRLQEPGRQSPLVIIPSTEFGARWFESALAEDPILNAAVVEDPNLFNRESDHLDVVLTHLLLEERFVGTGSWRR